MSHSNIDQQIKKYKFIFLLLMVLSGLTVFTHYMHLSVALAITVAMAIALTKGTMVAGYFMHLFGERKLVFTILLIMIVLFFVLLFLPILTASDPIKIQY